MVLAIHLGQFFSTAVTYYMAATKQDRRVVFGAYFLIDWTDNEVVVVEPVFQI